jgi:hypothetical protein
VPENFHANDCWQCECMSRRQFAQLPHQGNDMMTWSPTATVETLLPTASITPAPSWPKTQG